MTSQPLSLSVVVLNWNAAEDTIACIRPLLTWQRVQPHIWVVDNASADNSVRQIKQALPQVSLIANDHNLGFCGGSNAGIRAALAASDAPILLLNNDAAIAEADALHLIQTLEAQPDIGLLVPLLYEADGRSIIAAGGKNPALHLNTRVVPSAAGGVQLVETVSGTAALTRADLWRTVGLLDERFFFSTEMADLSLRARRHGYRAAVDYDARATHRTARSSALRHTLYVYYIVRNRFLILKNHARWRIDLWKFWLAYTAVLALKLRLTGERATATAVWLALGDALNGRWGGQNERVFARLGTQSSTEKKEKKS